MLDYKKEAAKEAILFLKNKNIIGLGAGATVAYIIDYIKEDKKILASKFVTSSFDTFHLLKKYDFNVEPVNAVSEIDIYIDGCDQLDKDLNALKSGGGIHTREKLLASMAKEFILAGDEGKYVDSFDKRFPVVVDVLPEAFPFVMAKIKQLYNNVLTVMRTSNSKTDPIITENGNYLAELWLTEWPDLSMLNQNLKCITGVIESSLFYKLAHKAIISGKSGTRIIERSV